MKTYIITGNQGEGKTTLLKKVVNLLKNRGVSVSGFYARGEFKNGERSSFDLVDVKTGASYALCKRKEPGKPGFVFNEKTLSVGENLLLPDKNICLYIIDEAGKMEIKGEVWHDSIKKLSDYGANILMVVRKDFVNEVVATFGFNAYKVFYAGGDPQKTASLIEKEIGYLCKK